MPEVPNQVVNDLQRKHVTANQWLLHLPFRIQIGAIVFLGRINERVVCYNIVGI